LAGLSLLEYGTRRKLSAVVTSLSLDSPSHHFLGCSASCCRRWDGSPSRATGFPGRQAA
jgi:hypothetical protein